MFVLLLHLSLQIDTLHENKISLISACIYHTSRSTTVLHEKQHLSNSVKVRQQWAQCDFRYWRVFFRNYIW